MAMRDKPKRVPNDVCHALLLLKGEERIDWYYLPVDKVEWTDPWYCHQN